MSLLRPPSSLSENLSGYTLSESLVSILSSSFVPSSSTRAVVVTMETGTLALAAVLSKKAAWTVDFDGMKRGINLEHPYFIVFFKDAAVKEQGFISRLFSTAVPKGIRPCVLISYVPESTNVREKMVLSSSKALLRANLMSHFNEKNVSDFSEYQADSAAELTYSAYSKYASIKGPMSQVEEELNALPKELSREDAKAAGFSLLARVSNPNAAAVLPAYASGGKYPPHQKSPLHPLRSKTYSDTLASVGVAALDGANKSKNLSLNVLSKEPELPREQVKLKHVVTQSRSSSDFIVPTEQVVLKPVYSSPQSCVFIGCKQVRSNRQGYCEVHAISLQQESEAEKLRTISDSKASAGSLELNTDVSLDAEGAEVHAPADHQFSCNDVESGEEKVGISI